MQITSNACGHICYLCHGVIWGDAVIADALDVDGTTIYHPSCYEAHMKKLLARIDKLKQSLQWIVDMPDTMRRAGEPRSSIGMAFESAKIAKEALDEDSKGEKPKA